MRAKPGDRIILAGELVDQPTRAGEVLEARGADGGPPYVVRWEDGHTSTMFPGPGAVLRVTDTEQSHHADVVARPELGTLREWSVRVSIFEKGDDTTATVALLADSPEALTAKGTSRRSSTDPGVVASFCMAKNTATRTMQFCADAAVQTLGGMGYMRGTKSERIYREVKVNMIGGGAEEIMKDLAARQLGL